MPEWAVVTTLVGKNQSYSDGVGTNASFYFPYDVAVDASGNLFVADRVNFRIRKVMVGVGMWIR